MAVLLTVLGLASACSSDSKDGGSDSSDRDAQDDGSNASNDEDPESADRNDDSDDPVDEDPSSPSGNQEDKDDEDEPSEVWAADGGIGDVSEEAGSCDKSQIAIQFAPMYSAYDGEHLFQVPATVVSIDPEAITWSLSDPEVASLAIVPNGVMLTIQKAGEATLIASAGSICGTSSLTVTEFDPEEWEVGSARYHNGEVLTRIPGRPGFMQSGEPLEAACTSCHGESATDGMFQSIAHTPAQTGGFSDEELIQIITEANLPEGAYFDESIISIDLWQTFHKWKMEEEQRRAIVVYLRSLTPTSQTGELVFNMGMGMGMGMGMPPFGFPDGGVGGAPDGGAP